MVTQWTIQTHGHLHNAKGNHIGEDETVEEEIIDPATVGFAFFSLLFYVSDHGDIIDVRQS